MYQGTIVNWHDQSQIKAPAIESVDNRPLFLHASSFDKGPEELRVVHGQKFYELYGTKMNFANHGQPAIQAANIIDGGGELLVKRVVAADAKLANIVLSITVTYQKVCDVTKVPVDVIEAAAIESNINTVLVSKTAPVISWSAVSVANAALKSDVVTGARTSTTNTVTMGNVVVAGEGEAMVSTRTFSHTATYPLIIVNDNGRGVSNKAVRIAPDYNTSKDNDNFYYNIGIFEGTAKIEAATATLNPDSVTSLRSYRFSEDTSEQVKFEVLEDVYTDYVELISELTGITIAQLQKYDLIFGQTNKKEAISYMDGLAQKAMTVDEESVDLASTYGIVLANGSNGAFTNAPFGTAAYTEALEAFFGGTSDESVWDIDTYKIAAVIDANYPETVKDKIASFVTFREDCEFFRDFGVEDNNTTFTYIYNKYKAQTIRNKFIADYFTTYQIYDPETKRRIKVTMMYDFARCMVSHFANGPYRPLAGVVNNMVLTSAIEGTINFVPRITPTTNQKSLLDDLRLNYAIFQNGKCVVQSLYTSQEDYTQLTYINNVLGIQEVIRAIRTSCPKQRFTFVSGSDFTYYADAVNNVLKGFKDNFAELSFGYKQNSLTASQKIFYASISFKYNNWAQTEVFDVYALPND